MDEPRSVDFQTRLGSRLVNMSSTLVETVSINYEDFNESFLTCGTCLCGYDGGEHTPKLLPCSHTVCLHCLTRIAAAASQQRGGDPGTFRCPICREQITIPRGGVTALPPSFLVNQLLDLMSRQRREVVPKCSVHSNQELLFCETCDTVFCTVCTCGSHTGTGSTSSMATPGSTSAVSAAEHTIIPFSIAIKRMSEILLYKANECIAKLGQAQDSVRGELSRLNQARDRCLEQVDRSFEQVQALVEARRRAVRHEVNLATEVKKKVLEEQLALIDAEKEKVERECQGLQYQVEVRNITQRISSLGEKLDAAVTLSEPRENAFLCWEPHSSTQTTSSDQSTDAGELLRAIELAVAQLGKVRTSTTFPSLCTLQLEDIPIAGISAEARLSTLDYHGQPRTTGGDPLLVTLRQDDKEELLPSEVVDRENGSYTIRFRTRKPGRYLLQATIFDRPVRDSPLIFEVTEHNNPISTFGGRGSDKEHLLQPVGVAVDPEEGFAYILDTGNSRIKVLDSETLKCVAHLENDALAGRSCTGIAYAQEELVVVNWRTKTITRLSKEDGRTLHSFTHNNLQEPIDVAVDPAYGHILVADNGLSCVIVFDQQGKYLFQVGKKGTGKGCFNHLNAVTVGPQSEIIVADSRIQVFSPKGDFIRELYSEGKGRGRYCGVCVCEVPASAGAPAETLIIASRSDKSRQCVHVLRLDDGQLLAELDSNTSRLKRPSGVATTKNQHVLVVDLGNDALKKYRFW